MEKKDVLAIIILGLVFTAFGLAFVNTLFSTPEENYTETASPEPIAPGYDETGIDYLQSDEITDYTVVVDGVEGAKNPVPFMPLDDLNN